MWALALPVLAEQMLIIMVAFADQWLAGRFLEEPHLAAIGLVWYVMWALPTMFSVVAIGATALTARYVGGGKWRRATWVLNQALLAGGALVLVAMVAVAFGGGPFIRLMQLDAAAAPLAARYLWILLPVMPAMMVEQVGIACLRGAGDTASGLLAMSVVNAVNLALGAALVTGWSIAPQLGWDGLAIGTAAGHAVGAAIVLLLLAGGRGNLQLSIGRMRPSRVLLLRILRIGLPGGADAMAMVAIHMWYLSIINSLGVLAAAAHGLAVRIESLSYLPGGAFQVAATTMTGQYLGAGRPDRAARGALLCLAWGGGLMGLSAVAMYVSAEPLTLFFLGDQTRQVAVTATPLLRIVALAIPALAVLIILNGAIRGAGDTRFPLAVTFFGLLLIRIPLAYLWATDGIPGTTLEGWRWGVEGAWYAMLFDLTARGLLTLGRFVQGGWARIRL